MFLSPAGVRRVDICSAGEFEGLSLTVKEFEERRQR